MKNTKKVLALIFIIAIMVLAACGQDNEPEEPEEEVATEEEDSTEADEDEVEEEPEEEPEDDTAEDGEVMNPAIAEETDGDVEIVYTNDDPAYTNDLDGLIVNVHKYQIVKVTDMNQSQDLQFNEDLEGYAVTADVSVENTRDKDVRYNFGMEIRTDDTNDYIPSSERKYIPEDKQVSFEKDDFGRFAVDEEKNFFVTFVMTNDEFERVESSDTKFIIEGGATEDMESFTDMFGNEAVFDFISSDENEKDTADAPDLYQDKLTTDNIAKKEILFEDTAINETKEIDKAKVTIEGVQYAEITPNESSEARFENFGDDELVAVTIQVNVDNQSDVTIDNNGFSTTLIVNEGEANILSQGMLENASSREIEPGETGERQIVYLFEKKYFDIYEKYELEMGPFFGADGYLFKEKRLEFELPSK